MHEMHEIIAGYDCPVLVLASSDLQLIAEGTWYRKVVVRRTTEGPELSVYLISQDWGG